MLALHTVVPLGLLPELLCVALAQPLRLVGQLLGLATLLVLVGLQLVLGLLLVPRLQRLAPGLRDIGRLMLGV